MKMSRRTPLRLVTNGNSQLRSVFGLFPVGSRGLRVVAVVVVVLVVVAAVVVVVIVLLDLVVDAKRSILSELDRSGQKNRSGPLSNRTDVPTVCVSISLSGATGLTKRYRQKDMHRLFRQPRRLK